MIIKNNKKEMRQLRKELYWGILRGNVGKEIAFDEFVEVGKAVYGDAVTKSGCNYTLREMKAAPCPVPGGKLTISRSGAQLDRESSVLEEREQNNPEAKQLIGGIVWKVLFTDPVISEDQLGTAVPAVVHGEGFTCWLTNPVKEKILTLRHRPLVTMLLDAGSTVRAVAREFDNLPEIPLRVQVGAKGHLRDSLVRFNFTSNSVKIIELLSNSTHREDIGLTMIGGDVRTERLSVCGLGSQVFLDECVGGGDVSVIGTTGFGGKNGRSSFFCDNLEEARLKTSLLDRTSLRTLVLESGKLARDREFTRAFADLASGCIDLIFIDDGGSILPERKVSNDDHVEDDATKIDDFRKLVAAKVAQFREYAGGLGVSVAVAHSAERVPDDQNDNGH